MKFSLSNSRLIYFISFVYLFSSLIPFEKINFFLNVFTFVFLIILITSRKEIRKISLKKVVLILSIFAGLLLLFVLSKIHKVALSDYFVLYRRLMAPIVVFFIIDLMEGYRLSTFLKFYIWVIFIELCIALLQNLGLAPSILHQHYNNDVLEIFCGSFLNNNYLGNFFALIGVILLIEFFRNRGPLSRLFNSVYIILGLQIIIITGILNTGVRTSLLSYLIGVILTSIVFAKKRFLRGFLIVSLGIGILIFFLPSYSGSSTAINRIKEGIEDFSLNPNTLVENNSTLAFSILLYELSENPYIGDGKLFKSGYDVVRSFDKYLCITDDSNNFTDATIAVIFVEFGIIGIFIFFAPLFFAVRILYTKKNFTEIVIVSLVLLLQTITDLGLFNIVETIVVFIYFKVLKESYSEPQEQKSLIKTSE